ncbi:MAG: carbohydrate kinase [Bacillaceae bacterium]|nr:carbohydrate kinase [Bacillaceae bacterium]
MEVACVGELLIDFFCTDIDVDLVAGSNFQKQAGGAPANVAAAVTRLGGKALFAGKVGADPFGDFLVQVLDREQVDTSMILRDSENMTTMAFVSLTGDGERDFVFSSGADGNVTMDELDEGRILESGIIHFGSATALLDTPMRETYFSLMEKAKDKGNLISFDPNYRADLWKGKESEFIKLVEKAISFADFVKVSEEELAFISQRESLEEGTTILHELGAKTIAVTLGSRGTLLSICPNRAPSSSHGACHLSKNLLVPSMSIKAVDSTGAGDAFVGGVLYQLSNRPTPKEALTDIEGMKEIIGFANKVGAITCTKIGAISALPSIEEIEKY